MVQKLSDGRNDLIVAAAGSQAYHWTLCNRRILVHESVFTCHNDELFFWQNVMEMRKLVKTFLFGSACEATYLEA